MVSLPGMSNLIYAPLCKINAVPSALLRTFHTEEHVRRFIAGEMRFGLLQHYRVIEGSRQDETEGNGKLDLAASDQNGISILLGNGDGTFQNGIPIAVNASFPTFVVMTRS
jgi:hypothetical protein